MEANPRWESGKRMATSLRLANSWHKKQARKKDSEPYLGHLLGVASLVIEYGGTEEQACAALLHDAIEDQKKTPEQIEKAVGSAAVARMVVGCTESYVIPKGKTKNEVWAERKQWYLDHLRKKPARDGSVLVALADKVNNCEKTLRDFREFRNNPTRLWRDFNAGDSCQKWWYEQLVREFKAKNLTGPQKRLVLRFEATVKELFGGRKIVPCNRNHQHWQDLKKVAK
jgi:hypothetical protein